MSTLFATPTPATRAMLTESYRPRKVSEFIGLSKPRQICERIIASPMECGLLFVGEPGQGKTTMALALAEQLPAELHHIASQDCNLENLKRVVNSCYYVPASGYKMHLVLIDEADKMSAAAQLWLLSKLDSTGRIPNTIFVFTCNSLDGLEQRFIDRNFYVEFSSYGNSKEAVSYLELVWQLEAPSDAAAPNFARLVKEANGNLRSALMRLQQELMFV